MIFVSVASYRDTELPKTVTDMINKADNPRNLVFGIVEQEMRNKFNDFSHISNVRHVKMPYQDAKGAGYARKVAMGLYDGEEYFFQTDSHMRFAKGWDSKLIEMYESLAFEKGHRNIILSQFPAPYFVGSDGKDYYPKDDPDFLDYPTSTKVVNTWSGVWAGHRVDMDLSKPQPTQTVLGALLFSHGNIVNELPYDERICFMGEELCYAIRAYTRGWEMYAPNEMVAWHFYKRQERPKIWKDNLSDRSWTALEMYSQTVQKDVLLAIERGTFGIADFNKYLEYQELIGINFEDYYRDEMPIKANMGLLITETEFDEEFNMIEIAKTGYCTEGLHSQCLADQECMCLCHGGKNE